MLQAYKENHTNPKYMAWFGKVRQLKGTIMNAGDCVPLTEGSNCTTTNLHLESCRTGNNHFYLKPVFTKVIIATTMPEEDLRKLAVRLTDNERHLFETSRTCHVFQRSQACLVVEDITHETKVESYCRAHQYLGKYRCVQSPSLQCVKPHSFTQDAFWPPQD